MYGMCLRVKYRQKREESWLHGSAHDCDAVVPSLNGLPPGMAQYCGLDSEDCRGAKDTQIPYNIPEKKKDTKRVNFTVLQS
jgi:hypothetical protein